MTRRRPQDILRNCIARCARHRDGRGPWRAERACAVALGGSPIDIAAAGAARRLGQWLGAIQSPPVRGVAAVSPGPRAPGSFDWGADA